MIPDWMEKNPNCPAARAYPYIERLVYAYENAGAELAVNDGGGSGYEKMSGYDALEAIFAVDTSCLSARLGEKTIYVRLILENARYAISDWTSVGGELERIAWDSADKPL